MLSIPVAISFPMTRRVVLTKQQLRLRYMVLNSLKSGTSSTSPSDNQEADWFQTSRSPRSSSQRQPTPCLPSQNFLTLASSQFELLANSLKFSSTSTSKVKQVALYLPQENANTGSLEFLPMLFYPNPYDERIFIANQAGSGLPPHVPKILTKLPGFQHAQSLIPQYPFVERLDSEAGGGVSSSCGTVEEVMCDATGGSAGAALSVPLFHGSHTVGVVLIWPSSESGNHEAPDVDVEGGECKTGPFSEEDKNQVSRVAYSLSMALMMDTERMKSEMEVQVTQMQVEHLRVALSENLHQIKNPVQALRTFGKLLQRKVALEEQLGPLGKPTPLRNLADNLVIQSDRVSDLLLPMDSLLAALEPDIIDRELYLVGRDEKKVGNSVSALSSRNSTSSKGALMISPTPDRDKAKRKRQSRLSKITNVGDLELEMSFLADVLGPIIAAESAIAKDNGVKFVHNGDSEDNELPGVLICPKSLQEALSNLLNNAIKYSTIGPNGSVNEDPKVKLTLAPNDALVKVGVSIFIEDNGPGIPPSEREDVFERGYRGSAVKNHTSGDGIGLAVCRELISRMGGVVEILDRGPGMLGGATFCITLFRNPKTSLKRSSVAQMT